MSASSDLDPDAARADLLLQDALDRWNGGIHDCSETLSLAVQSLERVRKAVEHRVVSPNLTRKNIELIQDKIHLFAHKADASAAFWRGMTIFANTELSQSGLKKTGWQGIA